MIYKVVAVVICSCEMGYSITFADVEVNQRSADRRIFYHLTTFKTVDDLIYRVDMIGALCHLLKLSAILYIKVTITIKEIFSTYYFAGEMNTVT